MATTPIEYTLLAQLSRRLKDAPKGSARGLVDPVAQLLGCSEKTVYRKMEAAGFPTETSLTAITLAFRNPDASLIADQVLPRTPTGSDFKWLKYDLASGYTVPNTMVGRKSYPTEVEFNATEQLGSVVGYALDDFIPFEDTDEGVPGVNHEAQSAAFLTSLILLDREVRAAALVFNPANYAPQNVAPLSGAAQWSDPNSDPVTAILDALDTPIYRPNIGIFGQPAWSKLRRHPKLVQACKGTAQGAGVVSRQEVAELFELQEVFVGSGFVNNARKGQPVATSRVWGKHASFIYRDRIAGPQAGITWGFTAEFGGRLSGLIPDQKRGARGGHTVRVLERVQEVVSAPALGFHFQNVVA